MRRTLTLVAVTAALLVPAGAASAESVTNASCNNGKGGNGSAWNGKGQLEHLKGFCGPLVPLPDPAPVVGGEGEDPDSDELTPTSKLKRRIIGAKYAPQIEAMYR